LAARLTDSRGHQVNFVKISDTIYIVDVGFGGNCPTKPLPLTHGLISKWGVTEQECRLTCQAPKHSFLQGLWTFELRKSPTEEWIPMYNFATTEFFQRDFEIMSFSVSNRRTSWFTQTVFCVIFTLDDEVDDITGSVILSGRKLSSTMSALLDSASPPEIFCKDEAARIRTLAENFGIVLSPSEQAGIVGTVAELK
jgi:arylamine N-acetyltransferase